MPLNIDLHTHSFFSGDGVSSPEDMIAAARAKGLHGFAITDHNTCDAVNYLLQKGLMRLDGLPVDDFLILPDHHQRVLMRSCWSNRWLLNLVRT